MSRQKLPELGEGDEYEIRTPDELVYDLSDPVQRKVVGWRVDCFERLGLGVIEASALAVRRDIDRSQVENMLTNGASVNQVLSIVL